MKELLQLLRAVSDTLDGLEVAACAFDDDDNTLLWNRCFEKFFPEHAGHVHQGEPYRENLRRFYASRLGPDEMPDMERYVEEGIARHRSQQRPFTFRHRGIQLLVSSLPLPGIGRLRIWRPEVHYLGLSTEPGSVLPRSPQTLPTDGTALFDRLADGVMVTGPEDRIEWVNEAFVAMYGLPSRSAAVGHKLEAAFRTAWHGHEAEDQHSFQGGLAILQEQMRFAGAPFEVDLPGARCTRVVSQRSRDGMGFSVHVDITVMKRHQHALLMAERQARDSEALLKQKSALLETTLERMEQGIMMVDAGRIVQVCNRRAIELLDLPAELMASRPAFAQVLAYQWSVDEFAHTPEDLLEFVRAGGLLDRAHSYERKRPDGTILEINSVPMDDGGVLRTYTDITARKRSEEQIRHLARHDGLTSLVNRNAFLELLHQAVRAATEAGTRFAVHYIDLDRFKPINDQHGHAVGDRVLAIAARRMQHLAGSEDIVARMGGDEFAILQPGIERHDEALQLAQRILAGVSEPVQVDAMELAIGASIGIAIFPDAGITPEILIRHADAGMYTAKAQGSSACIFQHAPVSPASGAG